ncbi:hypothetical protein [Autumnicola psychrophila]|uniref:Outer membrane protein beta-barrel domain-containing protein n=1 Tax=Autumnicola psychrophila TaxID=3075592 RepID=A0ABU3DQ34_9FLAO|nr:hypothetical protein [Zunongwangia sp. F225]MDT0685816.1 hypothetical protein [Zunongwangia sp. F225]
MKKLILLFGIFLFGMQSSFSQDGDFILGVNVGLPVGDVEDISNFNVGADIGYLFGLAEIVKVGPTAGYMHFFGADGDDEGVEWEVDDFQFIPVGAAGRVDLGFLVVGLDLGYAIGVNDGNDGGFFYRPKAGFSLAMLNIIASYTNINVEDNFSVGTFNVGLEFGL